MGKPSIRNVKDKEKSINGKMILEMRLWSPVEFETKIAKHADTAFFPSLFFKIEYTSFVLETVLRETNT